MVSIILSIKFTLLTMVILGFASFQFYPYIVSPSHILGLSLPQRSQIISDSVFAYTVPLCFPPMPAHTHPPFIACWFLLIFQALAYMPPSQKGHPCTFCKIGSFFSLTNFYHLVVVTVVTVFNLYFCHAPLILYTL